LADTKPDIVCPRYGDRMTRTPPRLRRQTKVVCPQCGDEVVPDSHAGTLPPER
jgi:predicted RNA-binding Zn-ribbon protein involved in translation (DUF1610 family)